MAKVRIAGGTPDLDPLHEHGVVLDVADAVLGQWGVERRPSAVRLELGVTSEQLGAAGATSVDALGLGVGVLTGECPFGARLAQHVILLPRQLSPPLGLGLDHLADLSGRVALICSASRIGHEFRLTA
jgi:hypothetical protein